jgi:spore coat protein U-like protein
MSPARQFKSLGCFVRWMVVLMLLGFGAIAYGANCSVFMTTSVAFGAYNVYSASPLDSAGSVTWQCSVLRTDPYISISAGGAGSFTPRRMSSSNDTLDYNLYMDAARSVIWGDGSNGSSLYLFPPQKGQGTATIYGRIPALQDASVGAYSDAVTVMIVF